MSKLIDMIEQLCPEGVEYVRLGEVCEIIRGVRVTKKELIADGKYPVVSGGVGFMGYLNDYNREAETITIAQYGTAGYVNWQVRQFWANDICFCVNPSEKVIKKYLYYFLTCKQNYLYSISNRDAIPYSIDREKILNISFPLPPLPIQEEIVRILDTFTQLQDALQKEYELRKKQYNYYREQLLTFGEDVPRKRLGEIAKYSKGRIDAIDLNEENYVGVENLLQDRLGKTNSSCVPAEGRFARFEIGDILIGNIRPYLKKIWLSDRIGGTNGDVLAIQINDRDLICPEFLYQVLASDNFFLYDKQYSKGGKMPRGDKSAVLNYEIPLPPLSKQREIATILDKFSVLTTSLTEGIPAEIELRRKQYNYYRELLLTFKPKTL